MGFSLALNSYVYRYAIAILEIPICGSKPMSDQEILAAPAVRRLGRAGLEALPRSGPLR